MADGSYSRREVIRAAGAAAAALVVAPALASCAGGSGTSNIAFNDEVIPYGSTETQVGEIIVPLLSSPRPVVVLIHGGYWKVGFTREAMRSLATDLARVGYASWNLDYRRVGDPNEAYPDTLEDIAKGIDKLSEIAAGHRLDMDRVAFIGHSAGAQLAFWAAARNRAAPGAIGGRTLIEPKALVSLSGVLDLTDAAQNTAAVGAAELTSSAIAFVGGPPAAMPDRYAALSPINLVPFGIPTLLLHGTEDDRVSIEQSRTYLQAAQLSGDSVKLVELPANDHFDVVKSTKAGWDDVINWLEPILHPNQ